MKRPRSHPRATPVRRVRRRWARWLAGGLLIVAGLGALQFWRLTAPPPPVVNTTGFDPAITAAIDQARQAVLSSPRSAEPRGRMGMVLLAHEVRAPARECFAQASALAPREPRWPYYLGLAEQVDNPMAAATHLERAVELFPEGEPGPRLKLADTLLNLGRLEEAEAHYRRVRRRDSNSAPAALGLGKLANAQGRPTDSVIFLDAARDNPATRKAAYRLLVNVNQKLGRTNEAGQAARILAELPDDVALADPFYAEVEQLKTGEKAWTDLADEWIKTGRLMDAAPLLEKTVQAYPKSDRALFFLGRVRLRLGDSAGAEAALSRAVELAPDSVEAQMQLGVLRLTKGRPKSALPCFRAAIRAKPNLAEGWFNLGLSLGTEINRAESMAAFREAIRLKPNLIEAYLGLAVALRADGQNLAAAEELHRALNLQPEEPLRSKLLAQLKLIGEP
jgi:tetratricopeptide (TPR) repeat protein